MGTKMAKGVTLKDVAADKFICLRCATEESRTNRSPCLERHHEDCFLQGLSPYDPDWFYVRCAAVARQVYLHQGIGVGHLTIKFGGAKRRGTRPNTFARSSTNPVRSALKALESAGLIEKSRDGGRKITKAGQRELDTIAAT